MNPFKAFFQSNIFISLAAVSLTLETQVQLGMKPHWQPYLLFIFFAVLFEYNIHRLLPAMVNREGLTPDKHSSEDKNRKEIFILVFASGLGFLTSAFFLKVKTLFVFAPIGFLTIIYSILIFGNKDKLLLIRRIPFLKIILISFVWSVSTTVLPVIQSLEKFDRIHTALIIVERFCFIFALAIPFDIRDMETDRRARLKTVPLMLNENKAFTLSYLSLLAFFLISSFHYSIRNEWFIIAAMGISASSTFWLIHQKNFRKLRYYYDAILDGTMVLQGILIIVAYYFTYN